MISGGRDPNQARPVEEYKKLFENTRVSSGFLSTNIVSDYEVDNEKNVLRVTVKNEGRNKAIFDEWRNKIPFLTLVFEWLTVNILHEYINIYQFSLEELNSELDRRQLAESKTPEYQMARNFETVYADQSQKATVTPDRDKKDRYKITWTPAKPAEFDKDFHANFDVYFTIQKYNENVLSHPKVKAAHSSIPATFAPAENKNIPILPQALDDAIRDELKRLREKQEGFFGFLAIRCTSKSNRIIRARERVNAYLKENNISDINTILDWHGAEVKDGKELKLPSLREALNNPRFSPLNTTLWGQTKALDHVENKTGLKNK